MKRHYHKITIALALSLSLVLILAFFIQTQEVHAEKLYEVLKNPADGTPGGTIKGVWTSLLALVNYAMIGVLIFIAFMNILRIDISRYGIKKFLPTMILAVILANFSWAICRLLIDFANIVCDALINGPGPSAGISPDQNIMGIAGAFNNKLNNEYKTFVTLKGTFDWAQVFRLFVLTLSEFIGAAIILVLAFLFFLRNYIIYFLVALAPLTFMSMVLPQTRKFFDQWWSNFAKWTFMPVISLFWLWVGNKWLEPLTRDRTSILAIAMAIATYYMAITSPFKMGGSLMNSWYGWGKKGVKTFGGDLAVRKAKTWYDKQGDSNKWYNPLGHVIRTAKRWQMDEEHDKKAQAEAQDKTLGRMMKTKTGRRYLNSERMFGGTSEKAALEVERDFQGTSSGLKWMKGRQEWLDDKARTEAQIKRNFGEAQANFMNTARGRELMQENTRITQDALRYENDVKNIQQKNMIDFLKNNGAYQNDADAKLVKDYMASTTRNMVYEEGVKKSHQDLIDQVLQDQNHLQNMKEEAGIAETKASDLTRLKRLRTLVNAGRELDDENMKKWEQLEDKYGDVKDEDIDSIVTEQTARKNEIVAKAKEFYDGLMGKGYTHVEHMFDTANNRINGFLGIAAGQDDISGLKLGKGEADELTGKIGHLLMTRTGKLLSIEIKGDIEKRLDEATIEEIEAEIDPNGDGRYSEASKNFSNGLRHLNTPEQNREVEARRLALARVAKQNSNAEAPAAQRALVNMLSDKDTKAVVEMVNAAFDEIGTDAMREKKFTGTENAEQIKTKLRQFLRQGGRQSTIAFSAITNPTDMGFSKNPSGYAYAADGGEFAGQYSNPQNPNQAQIDFHEAGQRFQTIIIQSQEPKYSELAKVLGGQTAQVAQNIDGLKLELQTQRKYLGKDIADKLGIELSQGFRTKLVQEIAQLGTSATQEAVIKAVQSVVPGSVPQVQNINIGEVVAQAQGVEKAMQGIAVLEQHQNVAQHQPYLDHFAKLSEEQAKQQAAILQEAKKALQDTSIEKEKVLEIARSALSKTGFSPSDKELMDDTAVIRTVVSAADSGAAAAGAFKDGAYVPDQAVDNFVSLRVGAGKANTEEKPTMRDIEPPKK